MSNVYLAIFTHQPDQWGLRGDPYLWMLMATRLVGASDPADIDTVAVELRNAFKEITGRDVGVDENFQLDGIPTDGMSGGFISGRSWHETLIPLLLERAARHFEKRDRAGGR